jgi:glyoxylase-like metal-dependent hydrolase (beta-lactamase superfamily II)
MGTTRLDEGLALIDLNFQGHPHVIGAYLMEDAGERVLIESGPTSTLDALLGGLRHLGVAPQSISKVLVTHIHLDHAGASGTFIKRFPQATLHVHELGTRHMVDPEKLWSSASRIYGDMMVPLWGSIDPIPQDKVVSLQDGDTVAVGSRRLAVVYTPGHASHHVAYYDPEREAVFTGDVAAVRLPGMAYVRPPTPPPDIDLEAWDQSIERVRGLRPHTLNLTHFGPFTDVERHLQETRERLHAWGEVVREAQESGQGRPEMVDRLMMYGNKEIMRETDSAEVMEEYELATPYGMTVDGYLRYFRKQAERQP